MKFEKYDKNGEVSYSLGAYPTFELVKNKPKQVVCVLVHSKANATDELNKLKNLCKQNGIEIYEDDKSINRLSLKENCFVVGVFKKYSSSIITILFSKLYLSNDGCTILSFCSIPLSV